MRNLLVAACVLICAVDARAQTRDPSAGAKPSTRISGRVIAADNGQPVRRALVRLASAEQRESRTAFTDSAGRYEFSDLPQGRYTISASKSGYVTFAYGQTRLRQIAMPIEVRGSKGLDRADIRLPRGGVITGQVIDEFGDPVSGARVTAMWVRYVNGQRQLVAAGPSAETWDTGEYRIWSLLPGDYYLSATLRDAAADAVDANAHAGYAPNYYPGTANVAEAQPLKVALGQTATGALITMTTTKLSRVTGVAIDGRGQPAPAGIVVALQANSPARSRVIGEVKADGQFVVAGLAPGQYTLRASAIADEGPQTLSARVTITGQDVSGVVLQPVPAARISGRITFEEPGSVPNPRDLRVAIEPADVDAYDLLPRSSTANVGDDFRFEAATIPGRVRITTTTAASTWTVKSVTHRGVDVTDAGLELPAAETTDDVEVSLTKRVQEISGTVTSDRGEIVKDCTVFVFAKDREKRFGGSRHSAVARPDQDGRFWIGTLAPGDYFAIAVDELDEDERGNPEYVDAMSARATAFRLNDGEKKTLELKPAARPPF